MLPKNKRITKTLFQDIMQNGKVLTNPLFLFRFIPSTSPRFAFVAPKGIEKRSIHRIALRRKGYRTLEQTPLPPVSGIFFYKKEAKTAQFSHLKNEVQKTLLQIKH